MVRVGDLGMGRFLDIAMFSALQQMQYDALKILWHRRYILNESIHDQESET